MNRIVLAVATGVLLTASAYGDEVELATGEKLTGTIVSRDDRSVVLDHPVLGRLTIPTTQVKPPAPPPPKWKFKVEAGANGATGNVEQTDLRAAAQALLDDEERRFKVDLSYTYAKTEGDKTKDQKFIEAIHDWKFADSPWTVFATGRMDWDEFQDWDRRASIGAGVGYRFYDTDDFKLIGRIGLAETREWGTADPDDEDWRTEGILGAETSWKINETNSIEAKATYYPDLSDGGEYRLVGSASWSVKLAKDSNLSLKLGVEDEYDSHRTYPFEKNDFRYFAALLFEF